MWDILDFAFFSCRIWVNLFSFELFSLVPFYFGVVCVIFFRALHLCVFSKLLLRLCSQALDCLDEIHDKSSSDQEIKSQVMRISLWSHHNFSISSLLSPHSLSLHALSFLSPQIARMISQTRVCAWPQELVERARHI